MNKKVVFMFSGQGSQFQDMGTRFYQSNEIFHQWMDKLNILFKDYTGVSYFDVLSGKEYQGNSKNILYTHPGIFMTEYAISQVFLEEGISPDYVIGSSLGEYAAMTVCGALSYKKVFDIVMKQAKILSKECPKGRMITLLDSLDVYYDNPILYQNSQIVSKNFQNHFTIAVKEEVAVEILAFLKQKKTCAIDLPVEYPFHSDFMDDCEDEFKKQIDVETVSLKYKMCCGYTGNMIEHISKDYFWDCVRKQIHFAEGIKNITYGNDSVLLDLGPGGTMATFAKYIVKEESFVSYSPLSLFSRDNDLNGMIGKIKKEIQG